MESQEEEYKHSIWEIYYKERATASPEKRIALNKRMLRWQGLMKNGWTAGQAYYRVLEEETGKSPSYSSRPWRRQAPFVVLAIALVVAIVYCVVITRDRDALNTELESVQSVLTPIQADLSSTKQSLASTQADLDYLNNTLGSVQNELEATKAKLGATEAELELYKETLGVQVFSGVQPPYKGGGSSGQINLINNPIAANPTWQELKAFLLADPTDDEYYIESLFVCGNFAEVLHNNAEAAGIKTTFVTAHFEDNDIAHALNAFKTADRGLVYVDCTGKGFQLPTFEERDYEQSYLTELDKIAYVVEGKEYGLVSIDMADSPEYSFYETYRIKTEEYFSKLEAYNQEADAYNQALGGRVYLEEPQYSKFKAWHNRLDSMAAELEALLEELGGFY
ncbi:coiled-coil domain-containing protein [Chloroflexota bacterium]